MEELYILNQSQFVTSSDNLKHSSTLPYVFTEQGIAMLATVLKTKAASKISIRIMDAFVAMKHIISNGLLSNTIEYNLLDHDRFIIIDKNILYHCGASFKDLGKKCFGINKIEDKEYLNKYMK